MKNKKRSFTVIELLLSILIMGIILIPEIKLSESIIDKSTQVSMDINNTVKTVKSAVDVSMLACNCKSVAIEPDYIRFNYYDGTFKIYKLSNLNSNEHIDYDIATKLLKYSVTVAKPGNLTGEETSITEVKWKVEKVEIDENG